MADQNKVYNSPIEERPLDDGTRDAITEGLIDLLRPAVEEIDDRVKSVRYESQMELRQQIDSVADEYFCKTTSRQHIKAGPFVTSNNQQSLYERLKSHSFKCDGIDDLKKINDIESVPIDLEPYVKKLNNSRRRVMLINNILQNVQDRLNKLHTNVSKETARKKTLLDPGANFK